LEFRPAQKADDCPSAMLQAKRYREPKRVIDRVAQGPTYKLSYDVGTIEQLTRSAKGSYKLSVNPASNCARIFHTNLASQIHRITLVLQKRMLEGAG